MHQADMRASDAVPSSQARTKASTLAASTGSPRRLRSIELNGGEWGGHDRPALYARGRP